MAKEKKIGPEEKRYIREAFKTNLPEKHRAKLKMGDDSCSCEGCSCPPGSGDICDGGTYVGYSGGYYGSASA